MSSLVRPRLGRGAMGDGRVLWRRLVADVGAAACRSRCAWRLAFFACARATSCGMSARASHRALELTSQRAHPASPRVRLGRVLARRRSWSRRDVAWQAAPSRPEWRGAGLAMPLLVADGGQGGVKTRRHGPVRLARLAHVAHPRPSDEYPAVLADLAAPAAFGLRPCPPCTYTCLLVSASFRAGARRTSIGERRRRPYPRRRRPAPAAPSRDELHPRRNAYTSTDLPTGSL